MRHAAIALDELDAAAKAAQVAEAKFRADMAREIARLERERVVAFRRARFVRLLADAAVSAETTPAACVAQRRAVAGEFGWDAEGERHKVVLDRVEMLGRTLHTHNEMGEAGPSVSEALKEFEAWYQEHAGEPFYALFDQYVPETPLVDF